MEQQVVYLQVLIGGLLELVMAQHLAAWLQHSYTCMFLHTLLNSTT
jgi:hypothetical protein